MLNANLTFMGDELTIVRIFVQWSILSVPRPAALELESLMAGARQVLPSISRMFLYLMIVA